MHHCNYPYHPGMVYLPTWMVDFYDRLVGKYTIVPWMGHGLNVQKNCHLQQLLRLISTSYRRSWVHCFRPRSLKCLWQQNGNGTPIRGFRTHLKDERLDPTAITHEKKGHWPSKTLHEDMGSPSLCHLSGFRGFWVLILPWIVSS